MRTSSPTAGRPRPTPVGRLRLEPLEDRLAPATFTVTTTLDVVDPFDRKLSLREAITRANTLARPDTIILPAGVFKIALAGAGEDANATGDFDITGSVTIRGAGAGGTVIDGQLLDRVFEAIGSAPSSIKLVVHGLTVRNGNVAGGGGGIRFANADLAVLDCVVAGNRCSGAGGGISNAGATHTGSASVVRTTVARNVAGDDGGGVSVVGSSLALKGSTVRRNVAGGIGGGIEADATVSHSTISGNKAGSVGGGIFAGSATVTNSTISGNFAGDSGGGLAVLTNTTVTASTISGNVAAVDGGGIKNNGLTVVTLTDSTVSGNTAGRHGGGVRSLVVTATNSTIDGNIAAGDGGGIHVGTATLSNSTISGNSAGNHGGGVWAVHGTLLNVTVVENSAHSGGGVFHEVYYETFPGPAAPLGVRNTIIALNLVDFGGTGPDVSGDFDSQGHNLIGNGTGSTGFTNRVSGDLVGTSANPIDPEIGPLADNGGRTKTHALLANSVAIDRGDNGVALTTDQRGFGFPRKKDGNGNGRAVVDIGAFER